MALRLHCPHCHQSFQLEDDCPIGAPVHCPICTGLMTALPSAPARPESIIRAAGRKEAAASTPQPKWLPFPVLKPIDPPRRVVNRWAVGLTAATVLLALCSLVGAFWLAQRRPAVHDLVARANPIPLRVEPMPAPAEPDTPSETEQTQPEGPRGADATPLAPLDPRGADATPLAPAPQQDPIVRDILRRIEERREQDPWPQTKVRIVLPVRRRHVLTEEDLRKQLARAPELSVKTDSGSYETIDRISRRLGMLLETPPEARKRVLGQFEFDDALAKLPHPTLDPLLKRKDLAGLPMRLGPDCQLGKEAADNLQALSRKMRTHMQAVIQTAPGRSPARLDGPALLRQIVNDVRGRRAEENEWVQAEALPAVSQMLQAENKSCRLLLLDLLAEIKDASASVALAQRALFDLSAEVREAAVKKLSARPAAEYRAVLIDGLRHPWPPVMDHAAEALVALQDRDAVPKLIEALLDPSLYRPHKDKDGKVVVHELVRVNHLHNCLLCHAPSYATSDPVRGRIPDPSQPLPPLTQYYEDTSGIFVRADVTYLKQDFSVPQPVDRPGHWPAVQRFDYLVRTRPATPAEVLKPADDRMEAIASVLDELDRDWKQLLKEAVKK